MTKPFRFLAVLAFSVLATPGPAVSQTIYSQEDLTRIAQTVETGKPYSRVDCTDWMYKFLLSLGLQEPELKREVYMNALGGQWVRVDNPDKPGKPVVTAPAAQQKAIKEGAKGTKGVVEALVSRGLGTEVKDAGTAGNLRPGDLVQYWSLTPRMIGGKSYMVPSGHTALVLEVGADRVSFYGSHLSKKGVARLDLPFTAISGKIAFWAVRPSVPKSKQ